MTQPEQTLYSRFQPAARLLAIVIPKQVAAVSGEVDDFCFGSIPEVNARIDEVCFASINGLRDTSLSVR